MKRKKLLYVGNALSTSGKTITTIETLSKSLAQEGYEVSVTSHKANKVLRMLDMMATFMTSRHKIDIVLIDTYSTSNFWYAVIIAKMCRTFNIPYIPILHGGNLPERLKNNKAISKKLFGNALVNVAPSGYLYNAFAKPVLSGVEVADFNNTVLIPNSINKADYPFKERQTFQPKLLWVRSFATIYNPLMAIKVLERLIHTYPEATLTMVGPEKDESYEACIAFAKARELPVTFTGKLSKTQWTELSTDFNIFISTTDFDNTPVSIIEAMALGLAVVSTEVGGMPYLIDHKKDGILSPPEDVALFTQSIITVIENKEQTRQMTLKARKKVEGFDWSVVKEQWHKVLS